MSDDCGSSSHKPSTCSSLAQPSPSAPSGLRSAAERSPALDAGNTKNGADISRASTAHIEE